MNPLKGLGVDRFVFSTHVHLHFENDDHKNKTQEFEANNQSLIC